MSSNELVRYITEQMVSYFNRPKTERKEMRIQRKTTRPPFANRWFGIVPYAMSYLFKNLLKR